MDRSQIEQTIKEILAQRLALDPEQIAMDSDLRADLAMDSFDAIEVAFEIEDKFDIEIQEEEISNIRVVKDLANLISTHVLQNIDSNTI